MVKPYEMPRPLALTGGKTGRHTLTLLMTSHPKNIYLHIIYSP